VDEARPSHLQQNASKHVDASKQATNTMFLRDLEDQMAHDQANHSTFSWVMTALNEMLAYIIPATSG
jgi:hypothetical protein